MKVAIDIDNTIVDYRKLIIDYLVNNQYEFQNKYQLKSDFSINFIKNSIKNNLGDKVWQKIQSIIYSSYEKIAFYENVEVAFEEIGKLGHEIYLVSHKSTFGIGDSKRVNIRHISASRIYDWIYKNKFKKFISGIIFCETFEDKLGCLLHIQPNVIIDDLLKVHTEYRDNCKEKVVYHILFDGSTTLNKKENIQNKNIHLKKDWKSISEFFTTFS